MQLPTLDHLKKNGTPHWFGLGFAQLKISEDKRYHFWHPELGSDVGEEEVHNHRYDFTSYVLRGKLLNEIYSCNWSLPTLPMIMEEVSCKEGDEPSLIGEVAIDLASKHVLLAGSKYTMSSYVFHRSKALEKTITLLVRDKIKTDRARVIRLKDTPRLCPFRNKMSESALWDIIEDCLHDRPGYHLASIEKGVLGQPSKIIEEAMELQDAHLQGSRIMAAVEASDLYGAITHYLEENLPGISMDDLKTMSEITQRAFRNGRR